MSDIGRDASITLELVEFMQEHHVKRVVSVDHTARVSGAGARPKSTASNRRRQPGDTDRAASVSWRTRARTSIPASATFSLPVTFVVAHAL